MFLVLEVFWFGMFFFCGLYPVLNVFIFGCVCDLDVFGFLCFWFGTFLVLDIVHVFTHSAHSARHASIE